MAASSTIPSGVDGRAVENKTSIEVIESISEMLAVIQLDSKDTKRDADQDQTEDTASGQPIFFPLNYDQLKTAADSHKRLQAELNALQRKLDNMTWEKDRATEQWEKASSQFKECVRELNDAREDVNMATVHEPYFVVLLDGDNCLFKREYMENPEVGARAAATKLLRAAHKHVKSERPCAASEPPLRSHITLAVNARGLSWALARSWQLPQEMLHNWYITLNSEKLNLDVIAVGRGDQLADHKVREHFNLHVRQPGCKAVILGICHDKGYQGMLNEVLEELPGIEEKITLLTTCSTLPCYLDMPFPIIIWPHIFRTKPLDPSRSSPYGPRTKKRDRVEYPSEMSSDGGGSSRRSSRYEDGHSVAVRSGLLWYDDE